jgi:hypothetical protein
LKEAACVYREMRLGRTPIADGTRLIYSLRCMRDMLETLVLQELDERLTKLEDPTAPPNQSNFTVLQ